MAKVIPFPGRSGKRYAAAKSDRSSGNWRPADPQINDLLSMSGPAVRARVRQLMRDFPFFSRAKKVISDYVVGDGIVFQSRATDLKGNYNKKLAQQIEDGYKWFCDEADLSCKLHLKEMERLARDQDTECGEYFIVKTHSNKPGNYINTALQMYEADWLATYGTQVANKKHRLEQGIEYHTETGEVKAYHFTDPDSYGKPKRILAENVLHGFETLRPNQLRGITPFASGVMVCNDLRDCIEGEVDGFKFASKWLAFVKSVDPGGLQQSKGVDRSNIEHLENGIIEYLGLNEDIVLASNPRPSANLTPFVRLILCMLSVATGVPLELISGDYAGLSWAVVKVIRADFKHSLKPISTRHIRQNCMPIFRTFMDEAVLKGRLNIPGYFNNPYPALKGTWIPPVADPVDRLRDAKADMEEMKSKTRSPQEITGARGRQLEDVLDEIQEAEQMRKDRGLIEEETSTALANNPAAVVGQKSGGGHQAIDQESLKRTADSYGVTVRAGAITPQAEDEKYFREISGLPEMGVDATEAWESDGGVRRPITLKSGDEFDATGDLAVKENEESEEE